MRSPATGARAAAAALALLAGLLSVAAAPPAHAAGAQWSAGPTAAAAHTATAALDSGRVLELGGGQHEVFVPETSSYLPVADDPAGFVQPRLALPLTDGRVLVTADAGGADAAARRVVQLYSPTLGSWQSAGSMLADHAAPLGVSLPDGRALVVGASHLHGPPRAEVFSPLTGTWTATAPPPTNDATRAALSLLDSGEVLLFGGDGGAGDAVLWSPVTGTWRAAAPAPFGLCSATAQVLQNGDVLFAGGNQCGSGTYGSHIGGLLYEPAEDRWRIAGRSQVTERFRPGAALLEDGRVLVVGDGYLQNPDGSRGAATREAELYDPATDLWSLAGATAEGHQRSPATLLPDGRVLASQAGTSRTATELYTPLPHASTPARPAGAPAAVLHQHVVDATSSWAGRPIPVVGRLARSDDAAPLPGEPVELYARPASSGQWSKVAAGLTDASGTAVFHPTADVDTWFALRHPGTATAGQAAGRDRVATIVPVTVPDEPRPSARPADGAVDVSWIAGRDGGTDLRGFRVTVGSTSVTVSATASQVRVGGLANGTPYDVSVVAVSAHGSSRAGLAGYPVMPQAGLVTPTGRPLCGRLADRATVLTPGDPYLLCPAGVRVETGGLLRVDASQGPVTVRGRGASVLDVAGGDLRIDGGSAANPVTLEAAEPQPWGGIRHDQSFGRAGGTIDLRGAVIRGATSPVHVEHALRATLVDSTVSTTAAVGGPGVGLLETPALLDGVRIAGPFARGVFAEGSGTGRVRVRDTHVDGAAGNGVRIRRGLVTLERLRVTRSGLPVSPYQRAPAVVLQNVTASYGSGRDVGALTGSGNGIDAIVVSGRVVGELEWVTPTNGTSDHRLGYLLGPLSIGPGAQVTVPAGGVVKAASQSCDRYDPDALCRGSFHVDGGILRTAPGGSVLTSTADTSVGPTTCPSTLGACADSRNEWGGIWGSSGARVELVDATVRRAAQALHLDGSRDSASLLRGRVEHSVSGIGAYTTSVVVTQTSFASLGAPEPFNSGDSALELGTGSAVTGATFTDIDSNAIKLVGPGSVTDSAFLRVAGTSVDATRVEHPVLRRLSIRDSGTTPGGGGVPAVQLAGATFSLGPGHDVDTITGGGNAVEAVQLGGTLTSDAVWVTPSDGTAEHALGHYLGSTLEVAAGKTLTLPAGAVVAASPSSYATFGARLVLAGSSLDASAGGALLTSLHDPAIGPTGLCRLTKCPGADDWGGVDVQARGEQTGGFVLQGATVRHGPLTVVGPGADRPVVVRGSVLESSPLKVSAADVRVEDNRMSSGGVSVRSAGAVRVVGNTVHDAPDVGIRVGGGGTERLDQLALQRNHVSASGTRTFRTVSAIVVESSRIGIGPGEEVDGNTGAGNVVDAIGLSGVTLDSDVSWVTVRNASTPHPLGYTGMLSGDEYHHDDAVVVAPGRTLRVPKGGVVKLHDSLVLDGAHLDASAGDATVTSSGDDSVAPRTCDPGTAFGCGTGVRITLRDAGVRRATATFRGATLRVDVHNLSTATSSVDDPAHGVVAEHVRLTELTSDPGPVRLTDVRSSGGVALRDTRHQSVDLAPLGTSTVTNATVEGAPGAGLLLDRTEAVLDRVVLRGNGFDGSTYGTAGLVLLSVKGTVRCVDARENASGVHLWSASSTSIVDSVLTGNAASAEGRWDVDNQSLFSTTGVFWGQPGGPVAGQVRDTSRHTDLAPADAPPACAAADPVVPPGQPQDAQAIRNEDGTVTASWAPPADDGGAPVSGYLVTAPDGTQVHVEGTSWTTPDAPSSSVSLHIRALNAVAAGPPATTGTVAALPPPPEPEVPASPEPSPAPLPGDTTSPSPSPSATSSPSPSPETSSSPSPTAEPSVAPPPARNDGITRFAGPDRYSTAVEVSRGSFPATAEDVFVVVGTNWPDALAAGPAAAEVDAPVLPVQANAVPAVVLAEIDRLQPRRAWVVGGPAVVQEPVLDALRDKGIVVTRVSGADRYATAAAVAQRFFPSPEGAYYVSGATYADALGGGAAAAHRGWPLLLTAPASVPAATPVVGAERIVLGGPAAVTERVRAELGARRVSGADRYATAAAAALDAFGGAAVVYLATGLNFPDALAGVPAAARDRAPLLLAARDCVTTATRDAATTLGMRSLVVLGGVSVVSDRAAALTRC